MQYIHLLWDVPVFWWHAWGAVAYPLAEALGILGLIFSGIVVLFRYLEHRWKNKTHQEAVSASLEFFRDNLLTPSLAYLALFLILGFALGPYRVHETDRERLTKSQSSEHFFLAENKNLKTKLEEKRHGLSTEDPVFANTNQLLMAFDAFRHYQKGRPCVIYISAPSDADSGIASTVAQFSNSVSDCFTFGPLPPGNDEMDSFAASGMLPDRIVFHAVENDEAADQLYGRLAGLLPVHPSHGMPPHREKLYSLGKNSNGVTIRGETLIWLQFGSNVHWVSERSETESSRPVRSLDAWQSPR